MNHPIFSVSKTIFKSIEKKFIGYESSNSNSAPIIYVLMASLFFVIVSKLVRSLHGLGSSEILFFRSVISLLINSILISLLNHSPYPNDKEIHRLLLSRCIIAGIGHYCYYQAMYMLDVTESIPIFLTAPFFTTILAGIFLKEKLKPSLFLTLLCSFAGILLVVQPAFIKQFVGMDNLQVQVDQNERTMGFVFGFLQSFSISICTIIVKKLSSGTQNSIIIHYALISGTIIGGIDIINKGSFNQQVYEPENFICVCFIAIFNLSAQTLFSRALMLGQASKIVPFSYSQILFGLIIEIAIFHQEINLLSIFGAILIMLGNYQTIKNK